MTGAETKLDLITTDMRFVHFYYLQICRTPRVCLQMIETHDPDKWVWLMD